MRTIVRTLWADPTVGIVILVPPPWRSASSKLRPRPCTCETALGFVGTFQFWALVIGRSPCSVGSHLGCAEAHTRILYVPFTSRPSLSARGVHVCLLRGSTPQTPNSHWSINEYQSVLLLSVLRWSLEGWASGNPRGLPWCCLLPPPFCLALFLVLMAGSSLETTCLIC